MLVQTRDSRQQAMIRNLKKFYPEHLVCCLSGYFTNSVLKESGEEAVMIMRRIESSGLSSGGPQSPRESFSQHWSAQALEAVLESDCVRF